MIKKHGFKAAVALSVLGLSVAAYSAIGTLNAVDVTPQDVTSRPVEQIVSGITDLPSRQTPTVPSTPDDTPSIAETSDEPTVSDVQSDVDRNDEKQTLQYPEYFYLPVNGSVSKDFSDDELVFSNTMGDWRAHNGVDIAAQTGERVIAVADGIVTETGYSEAWGYFVAVDHGGGLCAKYCGLSEEIPVNADEYIKAGQIIGDIGEGGYEECADSTHLHLEMTYLSKPVDPVAIMHKKSA